VNETTVPKTFGLLPSVAKPLIVSRAVPPTILHALPS